MLSPSHQLHMDPRLAERLQRKKAVLDTYRPLPRDTVRRLNDDLKVFLTYHSNAIEGNSLSLYETQMVIDYGMTVHGHPLREYLEATNHAHAYQYVTSLIDKQEQITRDTILALHQLVMEQILEDEGEVPRDARLHSWLQFDAPTSSRRRTIDARMA